MQGFYLSLSILVLSAAVVSVSGSLLSGPDLENRPFSEAVAKVIEQMSLENQLVPEPDMGMEDLLLGWVRKLVVPSAVINHPMRELAYVKPQFTLEFPDSKTHFNLRREFALGGNCKNNHLTHDLTIGRETLEARCENHTWWLPHQLLHVPDGEFSVHLEGTSPVQFIKDTQPPKVTLTQPPVRATLSQLFKRKALKLAGSCSEERGVIRLRGLVDYETECSGGKWQVTQVVSRHRFLERELSVEHWDRAGNRSIIHRTFKYTRPSLTHYPKIKPKGAPVILSGECDPVGKAISIEAWNGQRIFTPCLEGGNWQAKLKPSMASGRHPLRLAGRDMSFVSALDSDGDLIPDQQDNCPHQANPDQEESQFAGVGKACLCGDINGDGGLDAKDLSQILSCSKTMGATHHDLHPCKRDPRSAQCLSRMQLAQKDCTRLELRPVGDRFRSWGINDVRAIHEALINQSVPQCGASRF